MKQAVRAGAAGILLIGTGISAALAQSGSLSPVSSPFAGWFGGEAESPVELDFQIAGDDDSLEGRLRGASLIAGARDEGRITGQDILAAARGDYARILGTLYDAGYYDAEINITLDGVEAAQIATLDAPPVVRRVLVQVQPGTRFRFARADIAPVAPGSDIPSGYRAGETGGTGVIRDAAQAGVDGWREVGHAKADVAASDIVADHRNHSIDSRVVLAPGPALRFGRMHVRGNERLSERRLRKIAGFPEGERFDPEKIEDIRKRLRRSGVFSAITITEADEVGPGNTLDLDLLVMEQAPRRIGGGFELSSSDGLAVTGYWMHRNLLGGGERLRVDAQVSDIGAKDSGRDITAGIRLDRPATLHPDLTGYTELRGERLREEDYDMDALSFGFGFTYIKSDRLSADIGLQYRRLDVTDETGDSEFRLFALPMSVTWDQRDEPTDAKRGYWLKGELTPFLGQGDTGNGARLVTEGRTYHSFGEDDRITLAGRVRLGSVFGSEIEHTPRDYLFYSGGGGSVRGQSYESLGVEVLEGPDGDLVKTGGMSLANLSAEVRFQLRERIGLVAFADAGRVWDDSGWGGSSDWHGGAGVGVRYTTPIGPLRFDVAGPFGSTDDGVQVYLGLGQAF